MGNNQLRWNIKSIRNYYPHLTAILAILIVMTITLAAKSETKPNIPADEITHICINPFNHSECDGSCTCDGLGCITSNEQLMKVRTSVIHVPVFKTYSYKALAPQPGNDYATIDPYELGAAYQLTLETDGSIIVWDGRRYVGRLPYSSRCNLMRLIDKDNE